MVEACELRCGDGGAPGETLGNHGFEMMEVPLVEGGCFAGLDRRKDRHRVGPVGGVESE